MNHIVAGRESPYILIQATLRLENVRVDGQDTTVIVERWALFAEEPQHYYAVEVNHLPQSGQPAEVWVDLQAYVDSFRVIR